MIDVSANFKTDEFVNIMCPKCFTDFIERGAEY